MSKKIIFFDIDGTIIGEEDKTMLPSTQRAIEKARENGHICLINTGRTRKLVGKDVTGSVDFDGYLYGCGTMVVYHDQMLMHQTFSRELAVRIIDCLRRQRIDAILEGADNNFRDVIENMHTEYFQSFARSFDGKGFGSFEEAAGQFDKFYAYTPDRQAMEAFSREFTDELDFIDREHGFYEITPKGFSKATAIGILTDELGLDMADTVAIGDSNNDIPMLIAANMAIAMGNASAEVQALADYVTTDVMEDGIWNALDWLGLL